MRGNHLSMSIVPAPNPPTNHSHALLSVKLPTWSNPRCHLIHLLKPISTITVWSMSLLMTIGLVIATLAVLISQATKQLFKTASQCKNFAGNNCRRTCETSRNDDRPEPLLNMPFRSSSNSSAVRTAFRLLIIEVEAVTVHLSDKVSDKTSYFHKWLKSANFLFKWLPTKKYIQNTKITYT